MSSQVQPVGNAAAREVMYTLKVRGNGSLPHKVRMTWMQSAISVGSFCEGVLRVSCEAVQPSPVAYSVSPSSDMKVTAHSVAVDQLGISAAMGWLQGLVSTERDGYFENRRGHNEPVVFVTGKDTKHTEWRQTAV